MAAREGSGKGRMAPPALRFDGVSFSFGKGGAVEKVSLEVAAGEVVALVGPEGAGKSAIVRLAVGLLRPSAGKVEIFGDNVASSGPEALRRVGACFNPRPSRRAGPAGRTCATRPTSGASATRSGSTG